jgi:hypothetical protein
VPDRHDHRALTFQRASSVKILQSLVYQKRAAVIPCISTPFPHTVIEDRAVGALLGLAVDDALGATLEFSARDAHSPVTDKPHP